MKGKIIAILVMTLLIASALPVSGILNFKDLFNIEFENHYGDSESEDVIVESIFEDLTDIWNNFSNSEISDINKGDTSERGSLYHFTYTNFDRSLFIECDIGVYYNNDVIYYDLSFPGIPVTVISANIPNGNGICCATNVYDDRFTLKLMDHEGSYVTSGSTYVFWVAIHPREYNSGGLIIESDVTTGLNDGSTLNYDLSFPDIPVTLMNSQKNGEPYICGVINVGSSSCVVKIDDHTGAAISNNPYSLWIAIYPREYTSGDGLYIENDIVMRHQGDYEYYDLSFPGIPVTITNAQFGGTPYITTPANVDDTKFLWLMIKNDGSAVTTDVYSFWAAFHPREYGGNSPPNTPTTPSGPASGNTGTSYTYTTSATDPDGDNVYYWFDWDDGTNSGWVGPYTSGQTGSASHSWSSAGTYHIRAKAKDVNDAESGWSSSKTVVISDNQLPTAYIDSITPNPANQGDTVYFTGHGSDPDGYITGYNWRSSIDGQLSTSSSFNTNSLSSGSHIIFFKVKDDDNEWSPEVSETLTIVPQQPDLTVTSISIPAHPFNTRPVNISADIKNIGNSATPSFTCGLYVDGGTSPTSTVSVSGIQPGQTRTALFNDITLDAGSHTIKVVADINNVVPESNENNNTLEVTKRWIYAFELEVSLNWNAPDSFINELHDAFRSGSNYLYDLTDGYACYDSINIMENSTNWTTADIQIQQSYYVHPSAHRGGIDHSNQHIFLGQKWYHRIGSTIYHLIEDWSDQEGYRTIDHEFGHYGLYLFDEYYDEGQGRLGNCTGGNVGGNDAGAWSAMCNQINSTEFCNPSNHNSCCGLPTDSCWTEMNNHYSFMTIPTTVNSGPNDNVGQYMDFIGLAPSQNPPWGNTNVNWLMVGPMYPMPNQEVSVIINVADPDGINQINLYYSVNGGGYNSILMQHTTGLNYTASIPGQSGGDEVGFYFDIIDGGGFTFHYPIGQDFNYSVSSSNVPPEIINPVPSNGATGVLITTSTLCVDISDYEGDCFNWSIETSPDVGSDSATCEFNGTKCCTVSGLQLGTTYTWYVNATDSITGEITVEVFTFTTEGGDNLPPSPPIINGPSGGIPFVAYLYTFVSTDPDDDDVSYYIEWGDGKTTSWTSYRPSGPPGYSESHSWDRPGTYIIKAKAKDTEGAESSWTEFIFNCPRNKVINTLFLNFLNNFFEAHPNMFPLLQMLLQRLGL